jgi:hypothetical protein
MGSAKFATYFRQFTSDDLVQFAKSCGVVEPYAGKMARAVPVGMQPLGPLHICCVNNACGLNFEPLTGYLWSSASGATQKIGLEEGGDQHIFIIALLVGGEEGSDAESEEWTHLMVIPETQGEAPPLVLSLECVDHTYHVSRKLYLT